MLTNGRHTVQQQLTPAVLKTVIPRLLAVLLLQLQLVVPVPAVVVMVEVVEEGVVGLTPSRVTVRSRLAIIRVPFPFLECDITQLRWLPLMCLSLASLRHARAWKPSGPSTDRPLHLLAHGVPSAR